MSGARSCRWGAWRTVSCALAVAWVFGVAGTAQAFEAFDGRFQAHGFFQSNLRALNSDYGEDWDVAQWYMVFNLELEFDLIQDTIGPIDMMSAYIRAEVRYDCIYSSGYGMFYPTSKQAAAHRSSWELEHGPIPKGLCVLHTCDVRLCVNPRHLWLGTRGDNNRDRAEKGRSSDRRGELNPNTKLCAEQVREIRTTEATSDELARTYGVARRTINNILSYATWKELR